MVAGRPSKRMQEILGGGKHATGETVDAPFSQLEKRGGMKGTGTLDADILKKKVCCSDRYP